MPVPKQGLARARDGFLLPLRFLAVLWRDESLRPRYVRTVGLQLLVTIAVTGLVSGGAVMDALGERAERIDALASFYGSLVGVQWIVVAFSRDFDDAISRDLSLRTNLPPEDEAIAPRVRLDWAWAKRKIRQKVRGLLAFGVGLPLVAVLAWVLSRVMEAALGGRVSSSLSDGTYAVLSSLWGFAVFTAVTASKTGLAWEGEAPAPRLVRAWMGFSARVPVLGRVLQVYGRWLDRFLGKLAAPIHKVENDPWLFAGLTTARIVFGVGGLALALRPLVPIAAAAAVLGEAAPRAVEPPST